MLEKGCIQKIWLDVRTERRWSGNRTERGVNHTAAPVEKGVGFWGAKVGAGMLPYSPWPRWLSLFVPTLTYMLRSGSVAGAVTDGVRCGSYVSFLIGPRALPLGKKKLLALDNAQGSGVPDVNPHNKQGLGLPPLR